MTEPIWLTIARREMGVHETPGPDATARIVEYDAATTLKATSDEVPWCSAFINWCIRESRKTHPEIDEETHSAAAISWAGWGREVPDGEQQPGDIVVMARPGGHHVCFYLDEDEETVTCLGGNQGDAVKVSRFSWDRVINIRRPKNYRE